MDKRPIHRGSARSTAVVTGAVPRLPRVHPDWVARVRLLHQLDTGLSSVLTLVSAPAGFGKTTLLAQWVASTSLPVAWMTVREYNASPLAFFASLMKTIQALFPAAPIFLDTARLLGSAARAPDHYLEETIVRELSEIPAEFILVIDDFHLIRDDSVLKLINDFVTESPDNLHLFLLSRADPSLSLDRLRAQGELVEVRAAALQFTPEEVEAFLTPRFGEETSRTIAVETTRRTEGWIAGLRLALLSVHANLRPEEFLARLKASGGHHVMGYLVSEVLSQQPPHLQTFLLRTSVLNRLTGSLCDAVVGANEWDLQGHVMLEQIEQLGLFMTRLDEQGDWYRYHALFQELLQHELLARVGHDAVALLHHRASEWYDLRGMVDAALRHALKAEDLGAAARLVERQIEKALNEQHWRDLERWLTALPEPLVQERPALLVARAILHGIQDRLSAIPPLLRRAEELMREQPGMCEAIPDAVLQGRCDVMWAQDHYWQGESAEGLRAIERAMVALPPTLAFGRGTGVLYTAPLYQQAGEGEAGEQIVERLIDSDESAAVTGRALLSLCFSARQGGRLEKCRISAERLLAHAQRHHLLLDSTWAHYFLGWLAYERSKLHEARDHFLAVSEQRYFAHANSVSDSLSALALIQVAQGQATQAEEALQDLNQYALDLNHSVVLAAVAALRARLALARDDFVTALELSPLLNHPSSPPTPMIWLLPPSLTQAHIHLAQGGEDHVRHAFERLQSLEQFAQALHDEWRLYTIHGMQAMAHYGLGQSKEAVILLRQTLAAAQPQRYVRTFADYGPKMVDLLHAVQRDNLPTEITRYIDEILHACAPLSPVARAEIALPQAALDAQARLASPLTAREIEVLYLLDQRYSDKEIAQALVISSFTVHAHTHSIFRKLDVNDRREAALKARNIGLLQQTNASPQL